LVTDCPGQLHVEPSEHVAAHSALRSRGHPFLPGRPVRSLTPRKRRTKRPRPLPAVAPVEGSTEGLFLSLPSGLRMDKVRFD
jgi:hypothetical protein